MTCALYMLYIYHRVTDKKNVNWVIYQHEPWYVMLFIISSADEYKSPYKESLLIFINIYI